MSYLQSPISTWLLEERPREKLQQRGVDALSDAELLAIILRSGVQGASAIDLARDMIRESGGLAKLSTLNVQELLEFTGIGPAKAISIIAAFELARRKHLVLPKQVKFRSSTRVGEHVMARIGAAKQEMFLVLFLNRQNVIQGEGLIFKGGVSSTIVDTRVIFREAVQRLTSAIIVAHNHPSGNLNPSKADLDVTQKLVTIGELFSIQVLDHVIATEYNYLSFRDHGLMDAFEEKKAPV